jgi:tRNA A-37 threonylcarbamoyl transferase component Bud32
MFESGPKTTSSESLEALERQFLLQLKNLPEEIAEEWQNRLDNLYEVDEEFFADFTEFMDARLRALRGSLEIEPGLSEEIIKEIMDTEAMVQQTFGDPQHFLGNGRVAEVYDLPVAPHLCVKFVKDQQAYNEGNHLRTEFTFLEDLREFVVAGVRTPVPYFTRIHPSEGHSYGMERIYGKSLSQILERPAENKELVEMVRGMDKNTIKNNLVAYIKTLHEQFKITHGDLFLRNIMMDGEGNFYVIDFGKAMIEEIGEDHERRRNIDIATLTSEIGKFLRDIDNIDIS